MHNAGLWRVVGFAFALGALATLAIYSPPAGLFGTAMLIALATTPAGDSSMLTARGRALIMFAVILTTLGAWMPSVAIVGLLGASILMWVGGSWVLFSLKTYLGLPRLEVERRYHQAGRQVSTAWASLPLQVQLKLTNRSRWLLPALFIRDVHSRSEPWGLTTFRLTSNSEFKLDYVLQPKQPGVIRFAGTFARLQDLFGLFQSECFLPHTSSVTVLPLPGDGCHSRPTRKKFNFLPPPGAHRLRSPGTGSELLDLRDYRPGDPPKMIAWKPTARRDRLITKEFESEVPVRCMLLIDCSNSVRTGNDDDSPIARMVAIAADILVAAQSNRDLAGAAFVRAHDYRLVAPGRTTSHSIRLLNDLAQAASLLPDIPETDSALLISHVEPALRLRAPTRFDRISNSRPLGMFWKPLLDTRWGYLLLIPVFILTPMLMTEMTWLEVSAQVARQITPNTRQIFIDLSVFLAGFFATLLLPTLLTLIIWLAYGLRGFMWRSRAAVSRRKRIATIFAADDHDTPAAIERLLRDDGAFAARCGRFLARQRLRIPVRRYDAAGVDRLHDQAKTTTFAKALLRCVARACDNELYVLLADLIDCYTPEELLKAVKVARANHHAVLVILHWRPDVPLEIPPLPSPQTLEASLRRLEAVRWHRQFESLRRRLTQSGAIVLRDIDRDNVNAVLNLLDRLRGAGSRR